MKFDLIIGKDRNRLVFFNRDLFDKFVMYFIRNKFSYSTKISFDEGRFIYQINLSKSYTSKDFIKLFIELCHKVPHAINSPFK